MSQIVRKGIQDQAINNSKVDPTDTYTITGLRVDQNNSVGRVVIGISNPLDALHIRKTDTSVGLMLDLADGTNGERYQIYSDATGFLNFRDTTTDNLFTIGTTNEIGHVGINTATIEDHFHISSPSTDAALRLDLDNGASGRAYRFVSDTDGAFRIIDVDDATTRVQIVDDGTLTYYNDATFVGSVEMIGFAMPTDVTNSYVLTSDSNGNGTWQAPAEESDWVIDGTDMFSGVLGNIGIGTTTPGYKLDVAGTVKMDNFKMSSGVTDGYVLTSDSNGNGTWQVPYDGTDSDWVIIGSIMFSGVSGFVGIGTANPLYKLDVRHVGSPFIANFACGGFDSMIRVTGFDSAFVGVNSGSTFIGSTGNLSGNNLVVLDSGEVGLGTTTPGFKLDVYHATDDIIGNFVSGDSIALIKVSDNVGDTYLGAVNSITTIGSNGALSDLNLNIKGTSGNVGIGTTDPEHILDVRTSDATMASFYSTHVDRGIIRIEVGDQLSHIVSEDGTTSIGGNPSLHANNLNILNASGNVGIGTVIPGNKLEVVGTVEMTGFVMPTDATNSYVLTSDGAGVGTWQIGDSDGDWTVDGTNMYSAVSGNVGIGTATPGVKLDVYHAGHPFPLHLRSGTQTAMFRVADNDSSVFLGTSLDQTSFFGGVAGLHENNIVVMGTGEVGLGTITPTIKLDVVGNARISAIGSSASSPTALYFDSTGELTSNTSDERLKYDIENLENALEKVVTLRGVDFKWRQNDEQMVGMIAQELQEEYPELVFTNKTTGYMGIRYEELTAVLLESIKESSLELSEMESNIESLESKVNEMMNM